MSNKIPIDSAALRQRIKEFIKEQGITIPKFYENANLEIGYQGFRSFYFGRTKTIEYGDGVKLLEMFGAIDSFEK